MPARLRGLIVSVIAVTAFAGSATAGPRAVLELFTSQGCSSCPPADRLLGRYVEDGDVVALSFPVDYWDYLGWKDTLAKHEYTERQRNYAVARGDRKVYTPQVVVNGTHHAVGSSKSGIESAIRSEGPLPIEVALKPEGDILQVEVAAADDGEPRRAAIWLVVFDRAVTVKIGKGENSNRTVTYNNVVRKMHRVAMWKGMAMNVDLPRSAVGPSEHDGCAILLQEEAKDGLPGRVLGATILGLPRS